MKLISIVPELNFWMIRVLKDSTVNDTFHKIPTVVSDSWREPNSVIELLFNENFLPESKSSSSTYNGLPNIENENEKPYIYKYRPCNLLTVTDKNILNRIQVYRWYSTIYAANSNKFWHMFDLTGAQYPATQNNGDIIFDSGAEYMDVSNSNVPNLPVDVDPETKSPYVATYNTKNFLTTNFPLVQHGAQEMKPWPPTPPIPESYNVFNFTDDDLMMLDMLYDYKVYGIFNLSNVNFESLIGCIAKLVYIYLEAFCLNKFDHFDTEDPVSDESNILCNLYEKYLVDIIYQLRARQYGVIFKNSDIINQHIVEENMYQFMIMKKENIRVTLTDDMIVSREVLITDNIPWDKRDFVLYKDGIILKSDVDYSLVLDFSDPTNVVAKVSFIKDIFVPGENLEFIYSYVEPYSAYSEDDGRNINNEFNNSSNEDIDGRVVQ
jgi:hypothetical protein